MDALQQPPCEDDNHPTQQRQQQQQHLQIQTTREMQLRQQEEDEAAVRFVRHDEEGGPTDDLRRTRIRIVVVTIGALLVTLVTVDALTTRYLEQAITAFVEWLAQHPVAGVGAVILVYIIATVCFVPGSLITVGVGFAFGLAFDSVFVAVLLASTAVFVGASLGSLCCLLLGRYLFREPVLRLASHYPIFRAIDRALEGNGFKIMLLLRLSPLIPYNALDYISGITSISVQHYSLALVGLLPGGIVMCYIGATASSLADGAAATENKAVRTAVLIAGLFFALAGTAVASYYSKIELDKILLQQEGLDGEHDNECPPEAPPEGLRLSHRNDDGDGGGTEQASRSLFAFGNKYQDVAQRMEPHELT